MFRIRGKWESGIFYLKYRIGKKNVTVVLYYGRIKF